MRTTVNVNDALLTEARQLAARTRRSLGDVVDDALRVLLSQRARVPTGGTVSLPTYGNGGLRPGVDLEDKDALSALLDEAAPHAAG